MQGSWPDCLSHYIYERWFKINTCRPHSRSNAFFAVIKALIFLRCEMKDVVNEALEAGSDGVMFVVLLCERLAQNELMFNLLGAPLQLSSCN